MDLFVLVTAGYLLGSVPFGVILGQVFGGVDVRQHGSGNIGMANVQRTVGSRVAVFVMALDMGKGVVAVILARVFADSSVIDAAAALAAMMGHNWSVFIGFKGGRGSATGLGALWALSPISGLVTTLVVASTIALSRYVSLGSVLGATAGAVVLVVVSAAGLNSLAYLWFALIAMPLIIVRHKENIARLLRGEERKIGSRESPAVEPKAERRKSFRWPRSA